MTINIIDGHSPQLIICFSTVTTCTVYTAHSILLYIISEDILPSQNLFSRCLLYTYTVCTVHTLYVQYRIQLQSQSNQSAGPVSFLIFCSISIFLLASLVAGRKPQGTAGADQQGMYSTIPIHWNIKSAPARPGRSRVGPAFYVFSFLGYSTAADSSFTHFSPRYIIVCNTAPDWRAF